MAARQVLSRIEEGYHPLVNRLHDVFFPRGSSSTPLSHLYRMDVETAEVKLALQAGCAMLKRSHTIHQLALIMVLCPHLDPSRAPDPETNPDYEFITNPDPD